MKSKDSDGGPRIVRAAEAGDEVVITRNGEPAVRLVPVRRTGRTPFRFGVLEGVIDPRVCPKFFRAIDRSRAGRLGVTVVRKDRTCVDQEFGLRLLARCSRT